MDLRNAIKNPRKFQLQILTRSVCVLGVLAGDCEGDEGGGRLVLKPLPTKPLSKADVVQSSCPQVSGLQTLPSVS